MRICYHSIKLTGITASIRFLVSLSAISLILLSTGCRSNLCTSFNRGVYPPLFYSPRPPGIYPPVTPPASGVYPPVASTVMNYAANSPNAYPFAQVLPPSNPLPIAPSERTVSVFVISESTVFPNANPASRTYRVAQANPINYSSSQAGLPMGNTYPLVLPVSNPSGWEVNTQATTVPIANAGSATSAPINANQLPYSPGNSSPIMNPPVVPLANPTTNSGLNSQVLPPVNPPSNSGSNSPVLPPANTLTIPPSNSELNSPVFPPVNPEANSNN